ncbi:MAG TPA: hypothetical protein VIK34_05705 [Clostridiaceae bacterium]
MDNNEHIIKILKDKKNNQKAIKDKYDAKKKTKALTNDERISRIEEYLGLI